MDEQSTSVEKRLDGQAHRFSRWRLALACLILLTLVIVPSRVQVGEAKGNLAPQAQVGTAFTYQGRLTDGGSPANGEYDFRFTLYDAATAGNQVGSWVSKENVTVTDGLFTVELDFGSGIFTGEARYLEIGVRPGDSGAVHTTLSPRQELTPAPYALALPGLWTQQKTDCPNIIGGHADNLVSPDAYGATIGGGGSDTAPNQVLRNYGTVSGGAGNVAGSWRATVGGGVLNTASGDSSTVGGGSSNTADGYYSTVGGGNHNTSSSYDTVGGGQNNTASGGFATVGGGEYNIASDGATTVSGGYSNTASDNRATVGGGYDNTASGYGATIPGGNLNVAAGQYSFAAGNRAQANHDGAFVWADHRSFDFASTGARTFRARATGGVEFVLGVDGSGNPDWSCSVVDGDSWSCSSDRNLKENLVPVNGADVLQRLAEMPIYTWNGKRQTPDVRHMGPMAQDFYAAYGLGESDTHISTIDLDGVALAAVQELHARNQALQKEISAYKEKNTELEARVDDLQRQNADFEARLAALEQGTVSPSPATDLSVWSLLGGLVSIVGVVAVARYRGKPLLCKGDW
jgi:FtsZ-binding cell division protein ZapB